MKLRQMVEIESDLSLMFPEVSDAEVVEAEAELCGPEALKLHGEQIAKDLMDPEDPEATVKVRVLSAVLV